MNTITDVGNSIPEMTVKDFRDILKRNGFVGSESTVQRDRYGHGFEVVTKRVMNIGNLLEIERRCGLTVYLIDPRPDGNVRVIFGPYGIRRRTA
jgi:hypothetical protein